MDGIDGFAPISSPNLDYQGFGAKMTCQILVMAKEKTRICVLAWYYVVEMMGFEPTTPTLRT